jgi:flagellar hook-associated protein 1 FlgK
MIRPTFLGFETAKKGIGTSQKGLDITGQNLVNWDSNGYTRQRIEQVAVAQGSYTSRFTDNRIGQAGQGVDIVGISQLRDSFLDQRYREQFGETGYYEQANSILSDIQDTLDILDPQSDSGLRGRLMALLGFAGCLCRRARFRNQRQPLGNQREKPDADTAALEQKARRCGQAADLRYVHRGGQLQPEARRVAELNRIIMEDTNVIHSDARFGPNELYDERNLLLDDLSNMADLQATNNADGTVTVRVGGMIAVQGKQYEKLDMKCG